MDDTLDAMFDDDGMEEEMDEVVGAVLDEIGVDLSAKAGQLCSHSYPDHASLRLRHVVAWVKRRRRQMTRRTHC